MSTPGVTPFETILKLCRQAAPEPWYPAEFAASLGIDDGRFRGPLEELAVAGLIEPAKWHPERGQGYRLTRQGAAIVDSPGLLEELRASRTRDHGEEAEGPRPANRRGAARASLSTEKRPYATYAIFAVNIGMLLLAASIALGGNWGQGIRWFLIGGDAHARHVTGAASAAAIDAGQWWRLIASIFVHRDFFHLLINMSTFIAFGRLAERFWGCWRFALIYLISGLAYLCVSLWHNPSETPLGAAGSIFGTMLSVAAWLMLNQRSLPRETVRHGIRQVLGSAAWFLAWLALFAWLGGLEFRWAGYVVGALAGLTTGILLNRQQSMAGPVRWLFLLLVPLVPLASVGLVVQAKEKKPAWRDAANVQRKQQEEQRIAAEQQKKQNRDKGEFDKFNQDILPAVRKASDFIRKDWERIGDLCEDDPKKRDANEAAKAKTTLRDAEQLTDAALAAIDAAGPLKVDQVAGATDAARKFLKEQRKLLEQVERCLNANAELTDKEKGELREQADQTQRSWRILDKKLS